MDNYTKAIHVQDAYIINGEGTLVPTRFTIISKLDGDLVKYNMSFCSPHEKQFKKKDGVHFAKQAEEWSFPLSDIAEHNEREITNAIIADAVNNHFESIPRHHQRWFTDDNYGSDIRTILQNEQMVRSIAEEVLMTLEEQEVQESNIIH